MKLKKAFLYSSFVVVALLFTACKTIGYYGQAVEGQFEIFKNQKPVTKVLTDSKTPDRLKKKLELVLKVRHFAETNLSLKVDDQYSRYADLGREYVVWNVHASPEFSLDPKTWWYPFVGSAKYRGYFSEKAARKYAETLQRKGYDTYVEGVEAYSTLGWFKDPLLNTFIYNSDTALAETIFHELAHQRVFASGDTDFNEAFATAVAEEALHRWMESNGNQESYAKYRASRQRKDQFVHLIKTARNRLKSIYENVDAKASSPEARKKKALAIQDLRNDYAKLKMQWGGYSGYDHWFEGPLNNAQLNTVATYYDLVPAFHSLIQANGGDLEKFYKESNRLAKQSKPQRHETLAKLLQARASAIAENSTRIPPGKID